MIVVSLLLILVAVTLLVMGLVGGSSPFLISSIVASLLAAVALVIGARQAAALRRRPVVTEPATRPVPAPPARRGARRRDTAAGSAAGSAAYGAEGGAVRGDAHSDFSGSDPILVDNGHSPDAEPDVAAGQSPDAEPERAEGRRSPSAESGPADDRRFLDAESDLAEDQSALDAESAPADGHSSPNAGSAPADGHSPPNAESAPADGRGSPGAESALADGCGSPDAESALAGGRTSPDAESGFAGGHHVPAAEPTDGRTTSGAPANAHVGGRAADDDSDGRFADDAAPPPMSEADAHAAGEHDADAALAGDPAVEHARSIGDEDGRQEPDSVTGSAYAAEDSQSWRRDSHAEPSSTGQFSGAAAAHEARAGESDRSAPDAFSDQQPINSDLSDGSGSPGTTGVAEPDEDDPADEPPPQAVRPSDAVRVARMRAEVLVVDGRPRYHLAGCPHLAGRQPEPLPANEAVELGFSPCGQCRPVDRLVAQAAHH